MTELRVSSSRDRARLTGGFIAMPVVAALVASVGFPLVDWSGRPLWGGGESSPDAAISFATGVALVAIVVVPVAVVPAVMWLLRRGPVTLEQTLIGGFVFGILPVVIFWVWIGIVDPSSERRLSAVPRVAWLIRALLIGSTIGVLSAVAFWLIVATGRRKTT